MLILYYTCAHKMLICVSKFDSLLDKSSAISLPAARRQGLYDFSLFLDGD